MIMNWKVLDNDVGGCPAYIPRQKSIGIAAAAALGAGISALGGLASSAFSTSANASMDKETREWQEKMYDKNNAYNTPVNQRKRLEAAGINPALAFESGNTGAVSSAPSAVQHTPADYSALGAGLSAAGNIALQSQNIYANNELLASQTEANRIDNMTRLQKNIADIEESISRAKKNGADTSYLEWQLQRDQALFDALYKKSYADVDNVLADTELKREEKRHTALMADYQSIVNKYEIPNREKVLRNLDAQYEEILSAASNNNASAAYAAAQKALTDVNADTAKKIQKDVVERAFQEVESIKDEREIRWLGFEREERGEGKRLPNALGQYKAAKGYQQTVRQNKRQMYR